MFEIAALGIDKKKTMNQDLKDKCIPNNLQSRKPNTLFSLLYTQLLKLLFLNNLKT